MAENEGLVMWKESYRIGVDLVDEQHKSLCDMTEKLLRVIQGDDDDTRKQECINAIVFLKDYSIKHFAAEEEYQRTIDYCDIVAHKAIHRTFIFKVKKLEKELIASDFSMPNVKEFAGFLTSWLAYHICGVDQRLKSNERLSADAAAVVTSFLSSFKESAVNVFETMVGLPASSVTFETYAGHDDDIRVILGIVGDMKGEAVFTFTPDITFALIKAITSVEINEIDELAYSAVGEIVNIIGGNAATLVSANGKKSDIKPPVVLKDFAGADNRSGFYLDTELGKIAISVNVA